MKKEKPVEAERRIEAPDRTGLLHGQTASDATRNPPDNAVEKINRLALLGRTRQRQGSRSLGCERRKNEALYAP